MIAAPQTIEWRVGRARLLLPAAVHGVALIAGVEISLEWPAAWMFIAIVGLSAVADLLRWAAERRESNVLVLIPGGVAIDASVYGAVRAWLGPGCVAIWLKAVTTGRRRLIYVVRGEVTHADHAALRRHVKAMEF
jgi:hypothetical protein